MTLKLAAVLCPNKATSSENKIKYKDRWAVVVFVWPQISSNHSMVNVGEGASQVQAVKTPTFVSLVVQKYNSSMCLHELMVSC